MDYGAQMLLSLLSLVYAGKRLYSYRHMLAIKLS